MASVGSACTDARGSLRLRAVPAVADSALIRGAGSALATAPHGLGGIALGASLWALPLGLVVSAVLLTVQATGLGIATWQGPTDGSGD